MADTVDMALVREFAAGNSDRAFAAIVERHINLVYSVALRRLGDRQNAEEVTQAVFLILARKAASLRPGTVLSGWLYQTARLTAANFQRADQRRQRREQEAQMQFMQDSQPDVSWQRLAPLLEEAMARLGEQERNAVVLRFFENRTVLEVAASLNLKESTAQMRVHRATEKMRKFFVRRGVPLSAAILAAAIGTNAIQAAPAGMAGTVATLAAAKGAAAGLGTLTLMKTTLKLMASTKIKTAAFVSSVAVAIIVVTTIAVRGVLAGAVKSPDALAATTVHIAPEWKAHFKATLVIENCVFERTTFSTITNTELFQVRYQENAFLMREISSPAEADLDHIAGGNWYAGRWGSNYWAIEFGRVLKLFPDEKVIREHQNPDVSLIDGPQSTFLAALYYGFVRLDPATVEWLDESTFTASLVRGGRMRAKVLEAVDGLPTRLEWHSEANPQLESSLELRYLRKLDLPYYPSEISFRGQIKGKTVSVIDYRILSLKTSPKPLPATWFDPARYFSATNFTVSADNPNPAQVLRIMEDGTYYTNQQGVLEKVLGLPPDQAP